MQTVVAQKKFFILRMVCVALLSILCLSFSGCEEKEPDYSETTIEISKNGEIHNTLVGSFDKDYYNKDELKQLIEQEIAKYQSITGESGTVKLKEYSVEAGKVKAVVYYSSYEDYKKINNVELFHGTLAEAIEEGINTNVTLVSKATNERVLLKDAVGPNEKIVVFSEPVKIKVYGKIVYASANVEMIDEKQARMSSDSVGEAYIVIK